MVGKLQCTDCGIRVLAWRPPLSQTVRTCLHARNSCARCLSLYSCHYLLSGTAASTVTPGVIWGVAPVRLVDHPADATDEQQATRQLVSSVD